MRMKNKLIGVGVGLVLVAAAGVWAFAAQGVVGSPSGPRPDSTPGIATSEATATETDDLATETPEPTDDTLHATATPNLTPGAGDCEGRPDVDETDSTDAAATPAASDACNIEEEGEHADGDEPGDAIDQSTPHPGDGEKDHPAGNHLEETGD